MTWQEALVRAAERAAEAYEYEVWYRAVVSAPLTVLGIVVGVGAIIGGVMLLANKFDI